ncbi:unnamed protein product [Moneuplotes crassus]|uniref:Uncharacterized protein n=1 Tax=Euplotes crassus TaxID=5936 RepID=A0AAD1XBA4_EUPCR|nr:unnamed protein product [Moneuplotes crassus]
MEANNFQESTNESLEEVCKTERDLSEGEHGINHQLIDIICEKYSFRLSMCSDEAEKVINLTEETWSTINTLKSCANLKIRLPDCKGIYVKCLPIKYWRESSRSSSALTNYKSILPNFLRSCFPKKVEGCNFSIPSRFTNLKKLLNMKVLMENFSSVTSHLSFSRIVVGKDHLQKIMYGSRHAWMLELIDCIFLKQKFSNSFQNYQGDSKFQMMVFLIQECKYFGPERNGLYHMFESIATAVIKSPFKKKMMRMLFSSKIKIRNLSKLCESIESEFPFARSKATLKSIEIKFY